MTGESVATLHNDIEDNKRWFEGAREDVRRDAAFEQEIKTEMEELDPKMQAELRAQIEEAKKQSLSADAKFWAKLGQNDGKDKSSEVAQAGGSKGWKTFTKKKQSGEKSGEKDSGASQSEQPLSYAQALRKSRETAK